MNREGSIFLVFFVIFSVTSCSPGPEQHEGIAAYDLESDWVVQKLAWSPDGSSIVATVDTGEDHEIYVVDLETKDYHPIKDYKDRELYNAWGADWSPDSKSLILYYPSSIESAGPGQPFERLNPDDVVIVDAESGEIVQGVWYGGYGATWSDESNLVIVVDTGVDRANQHVPIYLIDLDTGDALEIGQTEAAYTLGGFDASTTGLLAYRNRDRLEIMEIRTREQVGTKSNERTVTSPVWSPDGQILAYLEDASNVEERKWSRVIYLTTPDAKCRSKPLDIDVAIKSIDWSPDGQQLAFSTNDPGALYFLDLTSGVGKDLLDSYRELCSK